MDTSRTVPLSQGYEAIVDADDYERVSQFKWHVKTNEKRTHCSAVRNIVNPETGRQTTRYLHHFILGSSQMTDHRNGNPLDNRKSNLRPATYSQNTANMHRPQKTGKTSRFKGVSWYLPTKKWVAQIRFMGKLTHLGYSSNEEAAARLYNDAAIRLFGEYACINKINTPGQHESETGSGGWSFCGSPPASDFPSAKA